MSHSPQLQSSGPVLSGKRRGRFRSHFQRVRMGHLSLCSHVRLLPLDVAFMPAPVTLTRKSFQDRKAQRVVATESDVGSVTQGPGVPDHQSVTHRR